MKKWTIKTIEQQERDKQQLALYARIDKEAYFHNLQLINKLNGVETYSEVIEADRICSGTNELKLITDPIDGTFDAEHLKQIHKVLFQDIYYFAGDYRDVDMEIDSITRFTPARRLQAESDRIFNKLREDNFLKGLGKTEFCDKLAIFMTELNKLHPFREGNGRSKRIFIGQLAQNAGYVLDWTAVSASEWKYADECAFDSARDYGQADMTYLKINLDKATKHKVMSIDEFLTLDPNICLKESNMVSEME